MLIIDDFRNICYKKFSSLDLFKGNKLKERRFKVIGKKTLLLSLVIVLVGLGCLSFSGCSLEKEEIVRCDDLIMVNLSTIGVQAGFGGASMGVYVLFFENHPTGIAYLNQVTIKFDTSLCKPTVEAILKLRSDYIPDEGKLFNVVITFKDKEQMLEYWLVDR